MSTSDFAALGVTVDATAANRGLDALDRGLARVADSASKMDSALVRQTRQMQQSGAIANQFANAQKKLTDAEIELLEAGDKLIINLQRQTAAIGKTKAELLEMQAAEMGVAKDAAPLIARLKEAENAANGSAAGMKKLSLSSADAREDVRIFAEALARGDIGMATAQLGQFSQRGNNAALMLGALRSPLLYAGLGLGTLAAAAAMGHVELGRFNDAVKLTNGFVGFSGATLQQMSRQMGEANGSFADARAVLGTLAESGKFTGQTFELVAGAALKMATATGESADVIAKKFAESKGSVVELAISFDEKYHMMDTAVLDHIMSLERQGDKQRAMETLADAMASASQRRIDAEQAKLSELERKWNSVTTAAKGAWEAMKDAPGLALGMATDAAELAALKAQRNDKWSMGAIANAGGNAVSGLGKLVGGVVNGTPVDPADIARGGAGYLDKRIAELETKIAAAKEKDRVDSERRAAQSAGNNALSAIEQRVMSGKDQSATDAKVDALRKEFLALDKSDPTNARLKGVFVDPENGTVSGGLFDKLSKDIRDAAAGPKAAKGPTVRDAEASQVKVANEAYTAQLDAIKRSTEQQQKAVDYAHKAGLISDEIYYQAKTDLAEGAATQELDAMNGQMQALLNRSKFRDDVERNQNAQEIIQLNARIAAKQQDVAWTQMQNQADAAHAAEKKKFNDLLVEQKSIESDLKARKESLGEQRKAGSLTEVQYQQELNALYAETGARLLPIRDALAEIATVRPFDDKVVAALASVNDGLRNATKSAVDWKQAIGKTEQDAFTNFLTDLGNKSKSVGDSFMDMAATIGKAFLKMEADAAATSIFGILRQATGAKAGSSIIASLFASANGNAFAGGRPVTAFANGGAFTNSVATGPTVAPMALFGEAGPEAIMPLSRDGSGRLGVKASGQGGATSIVFENTYHVEANADKSYVQRMVEAGNRQSQAQIAELMKRNRNAFSRG